MGRRHDYALESAARTVRLPAFCSRMQCAHVRFTHMVKTLLAIHTLEVLLQISLNDVYLS